MEQSHAVIIMEYVGSRNLHSLLVERKEKSLGRSWLLGAAAQVSQVFTQMYFIRFPLPGLQCFATLSPTEGGAP